MTWRISRTPDRTAEKLTKLVLVSVARMRARVVLPEPGGPQKIIEKSLSSAIARARSVPGPVRCDWPT